MPDTPTIARATPDSVTSLTSLFEALKLELEAMAGEDPDLSALFDAKLTESATAAYDDGVRAAVVELIAKAAEAEANNDPRLEAHGLTGAQRDLKLLPVQRWMDERDGIVERMSSGTYGKRPSLLGSAQKKVLEAIDLILDSFVEGMGIGGIVKEYKKVFEQAL